MDKLHNLMFAGVGGQGSLLIAELTSMAAADAGYDVKQTEVHGVSQRGGSVETHVRFGKKIYSPIVTPGEADVVLALELLEALRFAHYAYPGKGIILVNDHEIIPGSVSGAEDMYPHNAKAFLRDKKMNVITLKATQKAHELGDGRIANVVMLGALSTLIDIPSQSWQKALKLRLPTRYLDGNLKAFAAGEQMVRKENAAV